MGGCHLCSPKLHKASVTRCCHQVTSWVSPTHQFCFLTRNQNAEASMLSRTTAKGCSEMQTSIKVRRFATGETSEAPIGERGPQSTRTQTTPAEINQYHIPPRPSIRTRIVADRTRADYSAKPAGIAALEARMEVEEEEERGGEGEGKRPTCSGGTPRGGRRTPGRSSPAGAAGGTRAATERGPPPWTRLPRGSGGGFG